MVNIINIYKCKEPYVYCGRGSSLGNPYPITEQMDRDIVCDMYEEYFNQQVDIEKNPEMLEQLRYIYKQAKQGDVNLGCFCYPNNRCHCSTIKRFIDEHLEKDK